MNKKANILAVMMAAMLLLAGCKDKADKVEVEDQPESVAQEQPTAQSFTSNKKDISFEYPTGWAVKEDSNMVIVSAPEDLAGAIIMADITYEVSLFLAGHGNMENSVNALAEKYALIACGSDAMESYSYNWQTGENGDIRATAAFSFGGMLLGFVDIEQVGSRVFLSISIAPNDERQDAISTAYTDINTSFNPGDTSGSLEPANLSDLGFAEAPSGFERFYNPVTGQFFMFPSDWQLASTGNDDYVALVNEYGAIMLMRNWTDEFYNIYNNNGNDISDCFDYFLDDCASELESLWGPLKYSGFQYMTPEGYELIKAPFNYTVQDGSTGRCFAELAQRPWDGTDYIQGTMALYKPGDSYSIDMFSVIMDTTLILYPDLG